MPFARRYPMLEKVTSITHHVEVCWSNCTRSVIVVSPLTNVYGITLWAKRLPVLVLPTWQTFTALPFIAVFTLTVKNLSETPIGSSTISVLLSDVNSMTDTQNVRFDVEGPQPTNLGNGLQWTQFVSPNSLDSEFWRKCWNSATTKMSETAGRKYSIFTFDSNLIRNIAWTSRMRGRGDNPLPCPI